MPEKVRIKNIDQYIRGFPPDVQAILKDIRRVVRTAAPQAVEVISYQMPAFRLNGKPFVWFAAYQHHISLYPVPAGDTALQKGLAPYVGGKGTLKFPLARPIPWEVLRQAVRALAAQTPEPLRSKHQVL
jgi:uncharacterized protein YdhG (YjbR/CyaY superfamily)